MKPLFKMIGLVRPLTLHMISAVILGVIGHLMATAISVLAIYALIAISSGSSFMSLMIAMIIVALARGILRYGEQNLNHYIAFKLLALIRHKIFYKLRTLAPSKLDTKGKGDLINLITTDIELLEVFFAHTISPVLIAIIFDLCIVIFITMQNFYLGLISLSAYITIGIILPLITNKRSDQEALHYRQESGELASFILETLRGIREIDAFAYDGERIKELEQMSTELKAHEKKLKDITRSNKSLVTFAIMFFDIAILVCGTLLSITSGMEATIVLVTTVTLMSAFGPTVAIADLSSTLQNTMAAAKRVEDLLEEEPLIKEVTDVKKTYFDDISITDLSFSYEKEKIFEHLDLKIKKGEIVGIRGKSGIGKSTLLKLIMRFYDPDSGHIYIKDKDLKEVATHDLRVMSAYMTQDADLFHDSIINNLKIAKADASDEEVTEASKKAQIHELIISLPDGYKTKISELGSSLSSGERQRLNLARIFLHQSDLILLDEPTSNLDSLSEGMILRALKEEAIDKTIVIVSHRDRSLRIADRIIDIKR